MVSEVDHVDLWRVPESGFTSDNSGDQSPLVIKTIGHVEPLGLQLGVQPKKTVPDCLYDTMFGQPIPTEAEAGFAGGDQISVPSMQTYAILDAAKVVNLPELLEASGLRHHCLFRGEAYDKMKNAAPWVVQLEDGNDFTRRLFTGPNGTNGLWDSDPGIYVRSHRTLDEVTNHVRKFTRVQDENRKWYLFRFYDSSFMSEAVRYNSDTIHPLFGSKFSDSIIVAVFDQNVETWRRNPIVKINNRRIVLRNEDRALFRLVHIRSIRRKCRALIEQSGDFDMERYEGASGDIFSSSIRSLDTIDFLKIDSLLYLSLIYTINMLRVDAHRPDLWRKIQSSESKLDFKARSRIYIKKTSPQLYKII